MSKKVHISALTNKELKQLIIKNITKRGLPKTMVKLLLETYSLVILIDKGFFKAENLKEGNEIVIRNITYVTGDHVIKPTGDK